MAIFCVGAAAIYWLGPAFGTIAILFCVSLEITAYFAWKQQTAKAGCLFLTINAITFFVLVPFLSVARVNYRWAGCRYNLHNIAIALRNYESTYGTLPPAYIADADGKPMHSWRVLLLPFIEQEQLYKQYRFDEPWDGPNNSQLHSIVLSIYRCPSNPTSGPTTNYFAVTGSETLWPGVNSTALAHIGDGPANTIMLVEYHSTGIHWMEPSDVEISRLANTSSSSTLHGMTGAHHHNGISFGNMAFADGHVQAVPNTVPVKSLRAALTISGGEKDRLPKVRLPQ
jgi:prepilin-type processing-associated H-X9-DG protein